MMTNHCITNCYKKTVDRMRSVVYNKSNRPCVLTDCNNKKNIKYYGHT